MARMTPLHDKYDFKTSVIVYFFEDGVLVSNVIWSQRMDNHV